MFDISWGKLVLIGVVALIVIGPKELPGVLRQLGFWMTKIRRMASEFQGQFQEAMREAEMADLKKQFDDTTSTLNSALDPSGFKTDLEKMINDPLAASDSTGATSTPATPPADPAAVAASATDAPGTALPTDPVALGTAPAAPEISVPMPDLPPPPETKDFASAEPAASSPAPDAKPEGGKAA